MPFYDRQSKMEIDSRSNARKYAKTSKAKVSCSDKTCRIFLDNIPYRVTEKDLDNIFGVIGPIRDISINYTKEGRSTGTGEITFFRHGDATVAMRKFNHAELFGREMKMKFVEDKEGGGRGDIMKRRAERREREERKDTRKRVTERRDDNEPKRSRIFRQKAKHIRNKMTNEKEKPEEKTLEPVEKMETEKTEQICSPMQVQQEMPIVPLETMA